MPRHFLCNVYRMVREDVREVTQTCAVGILRSTSGNPVKHSHSDATFLLWSGEAQGDLLAKEALHKVAVSSGALVAILVLHDDGLSHVRRFQDRLAVGNNAQQRNAKHFTDISNAELERPQHVTSINTSLNRLNTMLAASTRSGS